MGAIQPILYVVLLSIDVLYDSFGIIIGAKRISISRINYSSKYSNANFMTTSYYYYSVGYYESTK